MFQCEEKAFETFQMLNRCHLMCKWKKLDLQNLNVLVSFLMASLPIYSHVIQSDNIYKPIKNFPSSRVRKKFFHIWDVPNAKLERGHHKTYVDSCLIKVTYWLLLLISSGKCAVGDKNLKSITGIIPKPSQQMCRFSSWNNTNASDWTFFKLVLTRYCVCFGCSLFTGG